MKGLAFICVALLVSLVSANEGNSKTVAYGMGCLSDEVKNLRFALPKADWTALETIVTAQAPDMDENDLSENPVIKFAIEQEKNVTHDDGTWAMEYVDVDMWFECEAYSSESFECYHLYEFNETMLDAFGKLRMNVYVVAQKQLTVCVVVDTTTMTAVGRYQAYFAMVIFIAVFVALTLMFVHMTLAVLIGDIICFFLLWWFRGKPSLAEMVSWIDEGTIGLLMGMMLVVGVFSATGFFEVAASSVVKASKNVWVIIAALSTLTAVASAILDNTTTVLLFGPVSLQMSKMLHAKPLPFLIAMIFYCTLGGATTYVGDPPNLIIGNVLNFSFMDFIYNCAPIGIICCFYGFAYVWWLFRKDLYEEGHDPRKNGSVGKEKEKKALGDVELGASAPGAKTEATPLMAGGAAAPAPAVVALPDAHAPTEAAPATGFQSVAVAPVDAASHHDAHGVPALPAGEEEVKMDYKINNKPMFYKAVVMLLIIIFFFTMESFTTLSSAMVALIGSTILLTLVDRHEIAHFVEKVEWPALLFFAGLFVLVKMVDQMGLIRLIGNLITAIVENIPLSARLPVALIVILWVSAFVAAFCNNIAYTASMLPLIIQLANNPHLGLPLRPMAWTLALGVAYSANGSLVGAAANLVVAQLAKRAGCPITFIQFMKWGMPMLVITTFGAMIWVLVVYCWIGFSG